jgi:hypothetical protein
VSPKAPSITCAAAKLSFGGGVSEACATAI